MKHEERQFKNIENANARKALMVLISLYDVSSSIGSFEKDHDSVLVSTINQFQYVLCTVKSRYLEVDGTIFYKFKLPEVQINLHFG